LPLLELPEIVDGTMIAIPLMVAVDIIPPDKVDTTSVVYTEVMVVERV
jgi:hypothetical protein